LFYSTVCESKIKSLKSEKLPQMCDMNFMVDPNMMLYYCLG